MITKHSYGTHECELFRRSIFNKHLRLSRSLEKNYKKIAHSSYVAANQQLIDLDEELSIKSFSLLDTESLKTLAENRAKNCSEISSSNTESKQFLFRKLKVLAKRYKVVPPNPSDYNDDFLPCINRMCCESWWLSQFKKLQRTKIEEVSRKIHDVHYHGGIYCSSISLNFHRQQKKSNSDYLESKIAVNENGEEFTLKQLSDVSISNPRLRRIELITRCKGFEEYAKSNDHVALFITMTTPSRFHPMTKINAGSKSIVIPNKKYDSSTVKDAQNFLQNQWARISSKLNRNNIKPYGFRVAEPHHDGTPHWHFLLFVHPEKLQKLIHIFQEYAQKIEPEKGSKNHRLKIEKIKKGINPKTGNEYSATGYIIKYICKNIDGHGIDNTNAQNKDWESKNPIELAERIEAWARTHRIRQFQQIGGPAVTVYRQLRRLNEQRGLLEEMRKAADIGDWAGFVKLMGGVEIKRSNRPLSPAYSKSEKIDMNTGELVKKMCTRYGDEAKNSVVGVLLAGTVILTRLHVWQIKDNPKVKKNTTVTMHGMVGILSGIHEDSVMGKVPVNEVEKVIEVMREAHASAQREALDLCQ